MMSPEFNAATVAGAIAWVLLLPASALAFVKARRAQGEMWRTTQDLARRAEQLRLLNRFTFVLTQETRRHGGARYDAASPHHGRAGPASAAPPARRRCPRPGVRPLYPPARFPPGGRAGD